MSATPPTTNVWQLLLTLVTVRCEYLLERESQSFRTLRLTPCHPRSFLGRTMHAGGTNATKDSIRTLAVLTYCGGFLRTEENQWLVMQSDPAAAKALPRRALELAGYSMSLPFTYALSPLALNPDTSD